MASNEIVFSVKVQKDGNLKVVAKDAEKAAKSTEKLGSSTDTLNKKRSQYQKIEKGVGQAGLSSAKGFSKQAGAITGGLVPAYAVLAANIFAITAAFNALKQAAQVEVLEEGFATLGNTVGRTSSLMAGRLKDITEGAISTEQALRTAAAGFSAGFSISEMEGLAEIAKGASIALGRDLGDALDRLIRGTAKLEPEILDELGIFIRIDDAVSKYAAQLGKVPSALTNVQRQQAFLNEALDQGAKKFGDVQDIDVNPFDKLSASFRELAESFLQIINIAIVPFINFLSQNVTALMGVMVLFGTSVAKHMVPALSNMGKGTIEAAKAAKAAIPDLRAATKASVEAEQAAIGAAKVKVGKQSIFAQLQGKVAAGKGSPEDIKKSIQSLNASIKRREAFAKKAGSTISAEYIKETQQIEALKQRYIELHKLRAGSAADQAKAGFTASLGEAEEELGNSMNRIEKVGAVDGFKEARKGIKNYATSVSTANIEVNRLTKPGRFKMFANAAKAGFKVASAGARIFGAALINAIPVIGQIIFAVGLLIQGFKFLFSKAQELAGPMSELDTIADTAEEKFDQLADKIAKSREKLAEYSNESDKAAQRGRHLKAQYAVLNGVVGETADAFNRYSNAVKNQDIGFFERFTLYMKELGGKAVAAVANVLKTIADKIGSIGKAILNLPGISFFVDLGKKAVPAVKEITESVTEFGSGIVESSTNWLAGGDKTIGKFRAMADQFKTSVGAIVDADTTGLAEGVFGDAMDGKSMEAFIAELMKGVKTEEDLARAQAKLNSVMTKAADRTKALEAATTGLGKELTDAGQKSAEFMTSLTSKDKFEEFQGVIKGLQTTINESITALTDMEGKNDSLRASFKDNKAVFNQFGITFEEFAEKGGEAFKPVVDGLQRVIDATRNTKNQVAALKEGLKQLKIDDKIAKTTRAAKQMMQSFLIYGKMEVGLVNTAKNIEKDRKAAEELTAQEFVMKIQIIGMEHELLVAKIEFMQIGLKEDSDKYKNLEKQKGIIEAMTSMKVQTAVKEYNLAQATHKLTSMTAAQGVRGSALSATQTGSTADRIRGLQALTELDPSRKKLGEDATEGQKAAADIQDMRARVEGMKGVLGPAMDQLRELGPEGELVATVTAGGFAMADSFMHVAAEFQRTNDGMQRGAAIAGAIAQTISQVGQIMAAASAARVASIDKEIAAEQKRDGKSKESLTKIKQLEKRKEQMQRKAFEQQKKIQMASIIANTAMAAMAAWAPPPTGSGPLLGGFLSAAMVAIGAAQLAVVAGTSYQGGGSSVGSGGGKPSSVSIGKRGTTSDLSKSGGARGELSYFRGDRGTGGAEDFRPAFYGKKTNRATGGYVVGEQGPELFMPDRPGTIVPADDAANVGGATNVNFNISAIDASGVEEVLAQQQGNIIGMIRQAANSYGEEFMEDLDESTYTTPAVGRA